MEEALAALDRGETPDPQFEVVFHDPGDVHLVTRPKSLELLRAIVQHEPASIRETARLVDRDVSQVHRNLTELEALHLVELVDEGNAKRPVVWYDAIDIDLPLVKPAVDSDEATV
nr:transcriptional regulator [Haloarchaeobius amylolyticus]